MAFVTVTKNPALVVNALPAGIAAGGGAAATVGTLLLRHAHVYGSDRDRAGRKTHSILGAALLIVGVMAMGVGAAFPTSPGLHPFNGRNVLGAALLLAGLLGGHHAKLRGRRALALLLQGVGLAAFVGLASFDWTTDTVEGDGLLEFAGVAPSEWAGRAFTRNPKRAAVMGVGATLLFAEFALANGENCVYRAAGGAMLAAGYLCFAIGIGMPPV